MANFTPTQTWTQPTTDKISEKMSTAGAAQDPPVALPSLSNDDFMLAMVDGFMEQIQPAIAAIDPEAAGIDPAQIAAIATHTTQIADLQTDVLPIAANTAAIVTHTSQIATHTTAIATHTTAISDLQEEIEVVEDPPQATTVQNTAGSSSTVDAWMTAATWSVTPTCQRPHLLIGSTSCWVTVGGVAIKYRLVVNGTELVQRTWYLSATATHTALPPLQAVIPAGWIANPPTALSISMQACLGTATGALRYGVEDVTSFSLQAAPYLLNPAEIITQEIPGTGFQHATQIALSGVSTTSTTMVDVPLAVTTFVAPVAKTYGIVAVFDPYASPSSYGYARISVNDTVFSGEVLAATATAAHTTHVMMAALPCNAGSNTIKIQWRAATGQINSHAYARAQFMVFGNSAGGTSVPWVLPAWTALTLSGWVNANTSLYYGAEYVKDQYGFVHLRGWIWKSAAGSAATWHTIGTLPSGYRPSKPIRFAAMVGGAYAGAIQVSANGLIEVNSTGSITALSDTVALENVSFQADGG